MKNKHQTLSILLLTGIFILTIGCSGNRYPSQVGLLELADAYFKTIVHDPIDRTRGEYQVIECYLEIEKPQEALELAESITNWKQADGYAELARYYYQQQDKEIAGEFLDKAQIVMMEFRGWHQSYLSGKILRLRGQYDPPEEGDAELKKKVDQYDDVFLLALSEARELAKLGFFKEALAKVKGQESKHNNYNHLRHQIADAYYDLEQSAADQDSMEFREQFIQAGLDFFNAQPEVAQKYLRSKLVERLIEEGNLAQAKEAAKPFIDAYEEKVNAPDYEEHLFDSTAGLGIVNLLLVFEQPEQARTHLNRVAENVRKNAQVWKVPRDISIPYVEILKASAKLNDAEFFNQQLGYALDHIQKSADLGNLRIGARMAGELGCGIYPHAELIDQPNWKRMQALLEKFQALAETREFQAFRERI